MIARAGRPGPEWTGRRGRWWWPLLAVLFAAGVPAADFRVAQVETHLRDGLYTLDAILDLNFSPEALEALANGVPLTILVHLQVRRANGWIWETSVTDQEWRYALRLKPLSETYEVDRQPAAAGRSFVTREAAIAALGEIKGLQLVEQARLKPGQAYEVQVNVSLDIEELPLPLRPRAYLSPSWKHGSGWTKWPLKP
jgi:hypothetical protein